MKSYAIDTKLDLKNFRAAIIKVRHETLLLASVWFTTHQDICAMKSESRTKTMSYAQFKNKTFCL